MGTTFRIEQHVHNLMRMDWQSRHETFAYTKFHGARVRMAERVADAMSPADLLCGRSTGRVPPSIIALGDRVRSKQVTLEEAFAAEPAASRRRIQ
jgi:hypothetical protein